jgi:ferrous iron transport protein B
MSDITVALAGNPNAGKTSLFNLMTGARAHVGNYPGVTVEKREGFVHRGDRRLHVIDLPGTYSLTPYSMEELVARRFILDEKPDVVISVVDATNLERNLYLAVQLMEIGAPLVVALNMMDVAESRGIRIDVDKLSALLGAPVVSTVARTGAGLDRLLDTAVETARSPRPAAPKRIRYGPDIEERIAHIEKHLEEGDFGLDAYPNRWLAVKLLEGDDALLPYLDDDPEAGARVRGVIDELTRHLQQTLEDRPEGVIADHRYGFITSVTKQAVRYEGDLRRSVSDTLDVVLLHRLAGPLVLLLVLYGVYQITFWASGAPVGWFEAFFAWLADGVESLLPEGPLRSLLVSGVIDGVGGVIGFVPLIAFLFLAIAFLEDSGYMARIAFVLDRVLRTFGLHGSSVLALMVGGGISGGCAVPGVMAARTLRDPKERLATILVVPFMNCGAKLPVFAVLIGAFFVDHKARMMFLLTLISWAMALAASRILRWTILRGSQTPFVMELPPYRAPTLRGLIIHAWERTWQYLKKAGTVILAISILIWAAMTYPGLPQDLTAVFEHQRERVQAEYLAGPGGTYFQDAEGVESFAARIDRRADADPTDELAQAVNALSEDRTLSDRLRPYGPAAAGFLDMKRQLAEIEGAENTAQLKWSFAGRLGRWLEQITRPLNFDWRTNIALIGGFAAKEVIVSTLGTAYSMSEQPDQAAESLPQRLKTEPGWDRLTAFVLLLFVMIYSPCFVTLVTIAREAGWRWAVFAMVYTTLTAYFLCLAVMTVGRLWLG